MKFSDYFSQLIKKSKITKTAVALKLGVSLTYIINVSKGFDPPLTLDRCEKLVKILNLEEDERKKLLQLALRERLKKEDVMFLDLVGWQKQ